MKGKYDRNQEMDMPIVTRVAEVAKKHDVPTPDVALAWHWARGVEAPIVGCSKPGRVDDAVRALDLELSDEDLIYLEEPYQPHAPVGLVPRPGHNAMGGPPRRRTETAGATMRGWAWCPDAAFPWLGGSAPPRQRVGDV